MKLQFSIAAGLLFLSTIFAVTPSSLPAESRPASLETRCGWLSNPTPANVWLYDREAEWTIGVQGGYQVPGDWPWPTFKPRQWVVTNAGDHGYGCACLKLRVNKQTHQVLEVTSSRARPLLQCRQDPGLKKWSRRLS